MQAGSRAQLLCPGLAKGRAGMAARDILDKWRQGDGQVATRGMIRQCSWEKQAAHRCREEASL